LIQLEEVNKMNKNIPDQPKYAQIALDIAARIARGDLKENSRFSGRSTMSSEYGVSPETIRRALNLLQEMEIVEVHHNSGVVIKSKENALAYLQEYSFSNDIHQLKHDLKNLLKEREVLDQRILGVVNKIIDLNDRFSYSDPLKKFEFTIPSDSWLIGKTVKEAQFYQHTKATVIAIRRNRAMILSPGPDARFQVDDVIILIGEVDLAPRVVSFINSTVDLTGN